MVIWFCHEAGISLKATNKILVLFDQAEYEAKNEILTIRRGDGSYTRYQIGTGTADTQYASCRGPTRTRFCRTFVSSISIPPIRSAAGLWSYSLTRPPYVPPG